MVHTGRATRPVVLMRYCTDLCTWWILKGMSEAHRHDEPSIPFEDLPERMKRSRHRMGWDQDEIGNYLGVHQRTVANYETGKTEPKLALLKAWAAITNVPLDWLVFGSQPCSCGHGVVSEANTRSRCFTEYTLADEAAAGMDAIEDLLGNVAYADFDTVRNRLDEYDYCTDGADVFRFTPPSWIG